MQAKQVTTDSVGKKPTNTLREVDNKTLKTRVDNFIAAMEPRTKKRKNIFNDLMDFVLDYDQWSNSEEKSRDGDPILTFNFSEEYVERYMSRLFPRNTRTGIMEIGVKVFEDDDAKAQKYEEEILRVYKEDGLISLLLEQGINYLIGGAGCLYYPMNPINKQAKIISLDPRDVYLGWQGSRLVQFAYKEYFGTDFKIHYWDLGHHIILKINGDLESSEKNQNDFIPFAWCPNFPKPHSHEGRSKVLSLYDLDREYNFRASDYSKRIAENTEPPIAIMSDNVKEGGIERGRKKIHYLGSDDDVKYLLLPEEDNVTKWLDKVELKMRKKTGLLEIGSIQTRVSGESLSFQFSDMLDLIGFMRVFWDQCFRDLNNAILTYKFGRGEYKTDPVYQPVLVQDTKSRIEEVVIMIEKDILSRKDAIDELRGVENAEDKINEILEERKKFKNEKQKDDKDD